MRFMILRKADKATEAGAMPSEKLMAAISSYMEEMAKAGILLGGEGLKPTAAGARIKFRKGKPTVTDGPFAESKEVIAGYGMIQVKSLQEAIDWVKGWPAIDGDENVDLEIRPLYEPGEVCAGRTPEKREKDERAELTTTAAKI